MHHVLCVVIDVTDCSATYQTTHANNFIYISYMNYLIQVGAECLIHVNKDLLCGVKH